MDNYEDISNESVNYNLETFDWKIFLKKDNYKLADFGISK